MSEFILGVLAMAGVVLTPVVVQSTSYTCENHPENKMFPCGQTRWGADPATEGMACPVLWARMALFVPTRGILTCDDSGRYDSLYGLPHLDIRVATYDEAITWGVKEIVVYRTIAPRKGQERKLWD